MINPKRLRERFENDAILRDQRARVKTIQHSIFDLEREIDLAESSIRSRKREIAGEFNLIVSSPDELHCEKHPGARFNTNISNCKGKKGQTLENYVCSKCDFAEDEDESAAYKCSGCGIVRGTFQAVDWPNQGIGACKYVCYICGIELDSYYGMSY